MPVVTRSQSRLLARPTQLSLTPIRSPHNEASSTSELTEPSPSLIGSSQGKAPTTSDLPCPAFWPCESCLCRTGSFKRPEDSCLACGHPMDNHEPDINHPWNPMCQYICPREALVAALLEHVSIYGVVVIRATPMVGKSVLLKLLGHHIVHKEPGLEPIFFDWETRAKRGGVNYVEYLEGESNVWRRQNEKIRPYNSSATRVFLIDEAQDSYEEDGFWQMLKNYHRTRSNALYVLVCVYGTDVVPTHQFANLQSQARQMHCLQRVELRRTAPGMPCMLFTLNEFQVVFHKFAKSNDRIFEAGTDQYLFDISQGHPGMMGLLFYYLMHVSPMKSVQRLTLNSLQRLLVRGENSFVEYLQWNGRGIWSPSFEQYLDQKLKGIEYRHLSMMEVKKAICEVAKQPDGLTRPQENFDGFAFCHKMGLLHAEKPIKQSKETTFTFPSPLHRKVAYRRLLGPGQDALWPGFSLQQTCMHAISRFSPGAFTHRQRISGNRSWRFPERAFQNEMYLCLTLELLHLPVLAEHSNNEGRIDFFISDRMWGIEILQCGKYATINEHVARFAPHGKYRSLGLHDYIILNFCPKSGLSHIAIEGAEIESRLFHVVIEPDEFTAEFYTHDLKLLRSWSLGEGRKRLYARDEFDIEIKEPVPTQRELQMEMDSLRFRYECDQHMAQVAEDKAQVAEDKARAAEEKAQAAEEEIRLLKQQLDAKGAKEGKQAGSRSRKRKR